MDGCARAGATVKATSTMDRIIGRSLSWMSRILTLSAGAKRRFSRSPPVISGGAVQADPFFHGAILPLGGVLWAMGLRRVAGNLVGGRVGRGKRLDSTCHLRWRTGRPAGVRCSLGAAGRTQAAGSGSGVRGRDRRLRRTLADKAACLLASAKVDLNGKCVCPLFPHRGSTGSRPAKTGSA